MSRHNIYRGGEVHVLAHECSTCIFRPATRPVPGARVAGMVRDTLSEDAATIVCHSTLYREEIDNAICRGWWDRLSDRDPILRLAKLMGIVVDDPEPEKER